MAFYQTGPKKLTYLKFEKEQMNPNKNNFNFAIFLGMQRILFCPANVILQAFKDDLQM